jgi:hypothetical protein
LEDGCNELLTEFDRKLALLQQQQPKKKRTRTASVSTKTTSGNKKTIAAADGNKATSSSTPVALPGGITVQRVLEKKMERGGRILYFCQLSNQQQQWVSSFHLLNSTLNRWASASFKSTKQSIKKPLNSTLNRWASASLKATNQSIKKPLNSTLIVPPFDHDLRFQSLFWVMNRKPLKNLNMVPVVAELFPCWLQLVPNNLFRHPLIPLNQIKNRMKPFLPLKRVLLRHQQRNLIGGDVSRWKFPTIPLPRTA